MKVQLNKSLIQNITPSKWTRRIPLAIFLISTILAVILVVAYARVQKKSFIEVPEKIEPKEKFSFALLQGDLSNTNGFPFTLNFKFDENSNTISPKIGRAAFQKDIDYEIYHPGEEFAFTSETYTSDFEKNIAIGFCVTPSSDLLEKLIGSILSVDEFKFGMAFRNDLKTKSFKEEVSLLVQKDLVVVKGGDIKLDDWFISQLSRIVNSGKAKNEIILEIKLFFGSYGYFVPLQVYRGGRFNFLFEEKTEERAKKVGVDLTADLKKISGSINSSVSWNTTNSYAGMKISALGGSLTEFNKIDDIKTWYDSLNEDNYGLISYENILPISTFLPDDLRRQYAIYESDVNEYFKTSYEKFKILKAAANENVPPSGEKSHEWPIGVQYGEKHVLKKEFYVYKDVEWLHSEYNFLGKINSNCLLVGFKIEEDRGNDGHNGYWELTGDKSPLLKQSLSIKFTSGLLREQRWKVFMYYVELDD